MKISASILNCEDRINGVLELNNTDVSYIHIDVMDGKFVSNVEFDNIGEIKGVNRVTKYPMDVHLMMDNPIEYIKELGNMNIEFITIHLEIDKDKKEIFKSIRDLGYKVGLSIKPNTNVKEIVPYLDDIDMVLVMSVEPGLGGQMFIESTIDRVKELKKLIGDRNILIEVDGGINNENINKLDVVDIAVVGSYIVKSDNYKRSVEELISCNNTNYLSVQKSIIRDGVSSIFIISGIILLVIAFIKEEFDFFFYLFNLKLVIPGSIFLFLGIIFKIILSSNENINNKNFTKDEIKRKVIFYIVLLIISCLPFIFLLFYALKCLILGCSSFCFFGPCPSYSGFKGVIESSISFLVMFFWPVLLVGLILIIVSIVKLRKLKRLS